MARGDELASWVAGIVACGCAMDNDTEGEVVGLDIKTREERL